MKITPEIVELFRRADAAREHYDTYSPDCGSVPGQHCPECLTYIHAGEELQLALGLAPWQTNPIDVEDEPPDDPAAFGKWQDASQLRAQLLAAVAESAPRQVRSFRQDERGRRRPPTNPARTSGPADRRGGAPTDRRG